ncbi:MAG: phosphatase PAP2 family protein [Bacteroidales bacterium]|nr:phosphatase PAP2 family protein [Candidatus Egerieousia equi]
MLSSYLTSSAQYAYGSAAVSDNSSFVGESGDGNQNSEEASAISARMLTLSPSYLEGWTSASNGIELGNCSLYQATENQTVFDPKDVSRYQFRVRDELSFIPVPVIAAGFIAKAGKNNFREARFKLNSNFKSHVDDYIQHLPLATTVIFKAVGYEGKTKWGRFLVSGALSYATMGLLVNGIKYTAKEMRPDGSTANSFPSGHTATAFVAATILHKEYGLTRSPWYSILGYSVATTTGVMRTLNNRHWISDVMVGAGLGILSTDLGYVFGGLIFKNKGIQRLELENDSDLYKHPSFVSFGLGATKMNNLTIPEELYSMWGFAPTDDGKLRIGTGTTAHFEGAYYFNPYFGIGGKGRVSIYPVRANGFNAWEIDQKVQSLYPVAEGVGDVTDQMATYSFDIGPYFAVPFSKRWVMRGNLSLGYMHMSDYDIFFTDVKDLKARDIRNWKEEDLEKFFKEGHFIGDAIGAEESKCLKYGLGIGVSWAYRENICLSMNFAYDYARAPFKAYYYSDLTGTVAYEETGDIMASMDAATSYCDTKMNYHMLGFNFGMTFSF